MRSTDKALSTDRPASQIGGLVEAPRFVAKPQLHLAAACIIIVWVALFFVERAVSVRYGGYLLPWDASWYAKIAAHGYSFNGNPSEQQDIAFLPLFPMALRALWINDALAPLVVPIACATFASIGIFLLFLALAEKSGSLIGLTAMTLFVASPFSMYFLVGYSESLYLLALGLFLYLLICRRSPAWAACLAGVASAIRPYAIVLWACYILWEIIESSLGRRKVLARAALLSPVFLSGFFATEIFFYIKFGDLSLYRSIMGAWGLDPINTGWVAIYEHFRIQLQMLSRVEDYYQWWFPPNVAKLQWLAFTAAIIIWWRRLPPVTQAYGPALALFCILVTVTSQNLGRHMSTNFVFPLVIAYVIWPDGALARESHPGVAGHRRRNGTRFAFLGAALLIGLAVQASFVWRFYHGLWVS